MSPLHCVPRRLEEKSLFHTHTVVNLCLSLSLSVYFSECICSYLTFSLLQLTLCCFVLVFSVLLCFAITSLGEERANLSAFRTFVQFALVWFYLFPLPLSVWEGLRFVIVALPGLFFLPFSTVRSWYYTRCKFHVCL